MFGWSSLFCMFPLLDPNLLTSCESQLYSLSSTLNHFTRFFLFQSFFVIYPNSGPKFLKSLSPFLIVSIFFTENILRITIFGLPVHNFKWFYKKRRAGGWWDENTKGEETEREIEGEEFFKCEICWSSKKISGECCLKGEMRVDLWSLFSLPSTIHLMLLLMLVEFGTHLSNSRDKNFRKETFVYAKDTEKEEERCVIL